MAVRDTTAWRHAIIQRKVINNDSGEGRKIMCAWDTCERDGYEMYKIRENDAASGHTPRWYNYVFCTERHKQYWINNMRPGNNNNLPAGYRRSII